MGWYRRAKSFRVGVETPEELLDWMGGVEYGWMDADYKSREDYGEEFWDEYAMLLPEEVFEHKRGVCWDQTVFENAVFDREIKLPHVMIFIQQYKVSTHTFLGFQRDDKWYHFEHAFGMFKGIHGPYSSIEEMVRAVCEKMHDFESGEEGFGFSIMRPGDFKKKLTCKEFMDACGYDYERMEETDRQTTSSTDKEIRHAVPRHRQPRSQACRGGVCQNLAHDRHQ